MEEEKAAAYYNELVRKGGAAARFKQGLGFGTQTPPDTASSKKDAYFSMSNFVKSDSVAKSGQWEEERRDREKLETQNSFVSLPQLNPSRVAESVASKLGRKRVEDRNGSPRSPRGGRIVEKRRSRSDKRRSRSSSPSEHYRSREKEKRRDRGYTHTSRNRHSPDRIGHRRRSDSPRHRSTRCSSPRKKWVHERSRKRSRSPSDTSGSSFSAGRKKGKARSSRRRSSNSNTSSSPGSTLSARKRGRVSKRDGSPSPSVSSPEDQKRFQRKSRERGHTRSYRKSRSRSPYRGRHGRTSVSPRSRSKDYESKVKRHMDSLSGRGRAVSPVKARRGGEGKSFEGPEEVGRNGRGSAYKREKIPPCDYSKLIPGFDSMTSTERVKAKMKLQLSEAVVKDTGKGVSGEWERFNFNKEAPLDDDTQLNHFEDSTEAGDDTSFLQNTGSTFLSSTSQARREVQVQAAHEIAIFGMPVNLPHSEKKGPSIKGQQSGLIVESTDADSHIEKPVRTSPSRSFINEQVFLMQQKSWRERALKTKEQRAPSAGTSASA